MAGRVRRVRAENGRFGAAMDIACRGANEEVGGGGGVRLTKWWRKEQQLLVRTLKMEEHGTSSGCRSLVPESLSRHSYCPTSTTPRLSSQGEMSNRELPAPRPFYVLTLPPVSPAAAVPIRPHANPSLVDYTGKCLASLGSSHVGLLTRDSHTWNVGTYFTLPVCGDWISCVVC